MQVSAGYIAMLIGDSKWLFLWARHWIIHSNYLFKNSNSFRNKSSDCPYEGVIVSFTQPICSLWLCFELFLLAAQNSSKMAAQVTRNTVFKMFLSINLFKKTTAVQAVVVSSNMTVSIYNKGLDTCLEPSMQTLNLWCKKVVPCLLKCRIKAVSWLYTATTCPCDIALTYEGDILLGNYLFLPNAVLIHQVIFSAFVLHIVSQQLYIKGYCNR